MMSSTNDDNNAIDQIHKGDQLVRWKQREVNWDRQRKSFFAKKYFLERLAGCMLLFAFAPIIAVFWLLVKLTSKGPGFYRQTRVGLDGKEFQIYKLRSMRMDAEKNGPIWSTKKDDRKTRLGNFLRTLHLDELPQLINVAKGEMVLIGPRPERPEICKSLRLYILGYDQRNLVQPGITGLSQVNLPPDETLDDVNRKQILDLEYISATNWWLEIRIAVATFLRMCGIKGDTTMRWMCLCRRKLIVKMVMIHPASEFASPKFHNAWPIESRNEQLAGSYSRDQRFVWGPDSGLDEKGADQDSGLDLLQDDDSSTYSFLR